MTYEERRGLRVLIDRAARARVERTAQAEEEVMSLMGAGQSSRFDSGRKVKQRKRQRELTPAQQEKQRLRWRNAKRRKRSREPLLV